jgi:succinate-semialdehyde dehydrogenase/glutarate-semialdehyde dehydrogenase
MLSDFLLSKVKNKKLLSDKAYIGGKWCDSDSGSVVNIFDPSNDEVIATIPDMGATETKRAIDAASKAFKIWKMVLPKDKASILRRWYDLMILNQQDLVNILVAENGKPLKDALGEFKYAASFVEWFAEEAKRIYGDIYPVDRTHHRYLGVKEPFGVVAAITPWNFPYAMITRKAPPAIAAGCTIVLKPSEETPLCALALAKLAEEASMPEGVLNIVTGYPQAIGKEMTENNIVKKLSFTGSTQIGKLLYKECADSVKKLSLELGGNAPFIVFDDANIDLAVDGLMAVKTRNTGQACTSANRVFVHKNIVRIFADKLVKKISELKVGNGFDSNSDQGPLINKKSVEKVTRLVEDAVKNGAKILYQSEPLISKGYFYPVTVISVPNVELEICREEIFGPVIALYEFTSDDEVIEKANSTNYGLASYFYTSDKSRVWSVADKLEFGMVGINESMISNEVIPFGGVKHSGFGIEGSKHALDEFLKLKYYCMGDI